MIILHFVDYFSPNTHTFIYDYIIELDKNKVKNFVLTFNRVNEENRPYENVIVVKIKRDFYWVILRILAFFNNKPDKKWKIFRREIHSVVKKIKPDIIHAHFGPMGVIISPIAKQLKIPLVVSFYGYDISILIRQNFWLKKYSYLFNNGNLFFSMSNHICERLKKIGCPQNKIIRFAAGIIIENFNFRETIIDKENEVKLIHIGRFVEKKSPLLLIKAFKIVDDYFKDKIKLTLTLIGDGPLMKEVIALTNELGLNNKVNILGALNHSEIISQLNNSHIYTQHCITARNGDQEGLGVSFLEASAIGLPIVTTNHNGIPDAVVNNKTGFLVEEGDYETMAKKIIRLIEEPDIARSFGVQGRKHVEKNYDIHKQTKLALNYYSNLIK